MTRARGGSPPHDQRKSPRDDAERMFTVLVLRELYALSDEQVEYRTLVAQPTVEHFRGTEVPNYPLVQVGVHGRFLD